MAKRQGTNNAIQNTTQKTNDRATRTPLNTKVNSGATETVPSLLVAFLVLLLYDTNTTWYKNGVGQQYT